MVYYSASVHYISKEGELPKDIKEVLEKYGASIVAAPKEEENNNYYLNVDLGKCTTLDMMQFMKECSRTRGVCGVAGGSYKPSLVQRIRDILKK